MKILIGTIKYVVLVAFVGLALVTLGAYLNLPIPTKPLVVQTGSMEPAIPVGSLIIVAKGQANTLTKYVPGDIITFKKGSELVSHRIEDYVLDNGVIHYVTKGDANESIDNELIPEEDVVGKVLVTAPFVGKLVAFVKQPLGFVTLIAIPTILFIILELFTIFEEIRKKPKKESNPNNIYKPITLTALTLILVGTSLSYFSNTANSVGNTITTAPAFCDDGPTWLSAVTSTNQGLRKDGSPVLPGRSNPNIVLGPATWTPGGSTGFYSLGFGASAIWQFPHPILNNGASLTFYEVTNGTYPLETANILVSQTPNLADFVPLGSVNNTVPLADTLALSPTVSLPWIQYVRIVDTTNSAVHTNDADGYDIDAVSAAFGNCDEEPETEPEQGDIVSLKINEFVANPGTAFSNEWVEIYNDGNTAVDLTGWTLIDTAASVRSLTALGTINPGEFKVLETAEGWLNNASAESLTLRNPSVETIDSTSYSNSQADDISRGRDTDATGAFKTCTTATQGTSNNGSC